MFGSRPDQINRAEIICRVLVKIAGAGTRPVGRKTGIAPRVLIVLPELLRNKLKTAKALRVTVAPSLLATVDGAITRSSNQNVSCLRRTNARLTPWVRAWAVVSDPFFADDAACTVPRLLLQLCEQRARHVRGCAIAASCLKQSRGDPNGRELE